MSLVLVPMSGPDFDRRAAALRSRYADALQRERGMSSSAAQAEALRQMDLVLPRGLDSEKTILRSAQVDGETVGWIWVTLPGAPGRPDMAWLHNIDVDPAHQSKGYGRAMILAVEAELRRHDVTRFGLQVFGDNARAMQLYDSLGFSVTTQQMAKPLA